MTPTDILTILSTLGGFEAIKWAINAIAHRKPNARKENTSAHDDTGGGGVFPVTLPDKYLIKAEALIA